jgi:hypothetical protein
MKVALKGWRALRYTNSFNWAVQTRASPASFGVKAASQAAGRS